MPTNVSIGYSTVFSLKGVDDVFTPLAEVVTFTPPQMSRDTPDVSHMKSPNRYREVVSGLRDTGEATLELNYIPASGTQAKLLSQFRTGNQPSLTLDFANQIYKIGNVQSASTWKVTFPDGTVLQFDGLLNSLTPAVPLDDVMRIGVGIKVDGSPTWA